MDKILRQGRLIFAIGITEFGVENIVCARVGGGQMPVIPFVPAIPVLAYVVGAFLAAAGISIVANFRSRLAAILLGAFFFVCALAIQLPLVIAHPLDIGIRTTAFETLSICAAAWTLARTLPSTGRDFLSTSAAVGKILESGRYLFAISLVVFGISHFLVPRFIASLIPTWIPWPLFWAYFTGAAFVAGGIGIAVRVLDRWAGALLGLMFLFWFLFLHTPRIMTPPRSHDPDEWSSAFIALALCGACWIIARDARKSP
jgi:uncharacterized membrane protein YphA (DoxX/SURF4 family)